MIKTDPNDLIHRRALELLDLRPDHLYDIVPYVTLDDNLVLALRVLGHARPRGKLARKELGGLFQIDAKEVETVYVGCVFALGAFGPLDCDLDISGDVSDP